VSFRCNALWNVLTTCGFVLVGLKITIITVTCPLVSKIQMELKIAVIQVIVVQRRGNYLGFV